MVVRFSLSMLRRDDINPLKNQLTMISSIMKNDICVVCLPMGSYLGIITCFGTSPQETARTHVGQFIILLSYLP